jgi:hypothetical protein
MANPVLTAVPVGGWTKVAAAISTGHIRLPQNATPDAVVWTYRMAGGPAPLEADLPESRLFTEKDFDISVVDPIDVYLWALRTIDPVRVEKLS